mgnify:CR=1 FL=1
MNETPQKEGGAEPAPDAAEAASAEPAAGEPADGEPAALLAWTAQPFLRRRTRGWLTLAAILGIGLMAGMLTQAAHWALFSMLVLFLSLESFYLPTHYELHRDRVGVRKVFSKSGYPWTNFRRIYEDRHGLTLSPYRRRAFLEPYRSQRLLFDGGDAERIKEMVRALAARGTEWSRPDGAIEELRVAGEAPAAGEEAPGEAHAEAREASGGSVENCPGIARTVSAS